MTHHCLSPPAGPSRFSQEATAAPGRVSETSPTFDTGIGSPKLTPQGVKDISRWLSLRNHRHEYPVAQPTPEGSQRINKSPVSAFSALSTSLSPLLTCSCTQKCSCTIHVHNPFRRNIVSANNLQSSCTRPPWHTPLTRRTPHQPFRKIRRRSPSTKVRSFVGILAFRSPLAPLHPPRSAMTPLAQSRALCKRQARGDPHSLPRRGSYQSPGFPTLGCRAADQFLPQRGC
jgi:hypothetical protein